MTAQQRESIAEWAKHLNRSGEQSELVAGARCYVPNDESVFEEGKVEKVEYEGVTVLIRNGSRKTTVPRDHVFLCSELGAEGMEDMVLMKYLHEPSLLANLELRFKTKRIYTYIGSVLISVNPYKNVPIYTPSIIRMYNGVPVGALPPHIFALADAAYQSTRTEGKNQSILISGDSGAGKTEAVKLILTYLTAVSGRDKTKSKVKVTPQERILSSNPILEAFGNAKTSRNNNSSRFAKMVDVQFDRTGYIVGGRIQNYLLEKSRVVRQTRNERNFHAFYYLLAGADKTERAVWGLYDAKHYHFTNQTRVYEIKDVNSKLEYVGLKRAMTVGGVALQEQHHIFTLLAAILHLGNVRFEGEKQAQLKNPEVIKWVAHLLKCDAKLLTHALLNAEARVGDEVVEVPLSESKARDTRDTLAKELYGRNFDWVVNRLNEDMDAKEGQYATLVSLLDIFGFEAYDRNAFEQFCINYANERLQFEFNEFIFKREKAEYVKERLDVSDFVFDDNQPALELIERENGGMLALLEAETLSKNGTDMTLLAKVKALPECQPRFWRPRIDEPVFAVNHFAGEVLYDVRGFVETNRENFSPALLKAVRSSRIEHFVKLFADVDEKNPSRRGKGHSMAYAFHESLLELMKKLRAAHPQYVRTIRPNEEQSSDVFDRVEVLRQLRCSGVLDTVRIRKDGYPHRRPFEEFLIRYEMLAPPLKIADTRARIVALMKELKVRPSRYQIGATKVFMKDEVFHQLEGARSKYYNSAAIKIQAVLKGYTGRMRYRRLVQACKVLQYWVRQYLEAVDVSEVVDEKLDKIKTAEKANDKREVVQAVTALSEMAGRAANVDTIVEKGGIDTILHAIDDEKVEGELLMAGTEVLGKMARKPEVSTSIARAGAVSSMVRNINVRHDANEQGHSIQLLGDLSQEEKNVGIVIREGGLEALTNALARNTRIEMISDTHASAAAQALGNLTQSQRVARSIGRDHQAIKAVIEGINQKPKYARLTQYSINCLANMAQSRENVDSIVDLGGIDTLIQAMRLHGTNEQVMKEVARTFQALSRNPMYAKVIGEQSGIDLALSILKEDPEHAGQHAIDIVQSLCSHPANTTKLLKNGGIRIFLGILKSDLQVEPVLTTAARMLGALAQDSIIAVQIVEEEGPKIILDSLNANTTFAEHNRHCVVALLRLAQNDKDTYTALRSMEVVAAVCRAMERHATDQDVVETGKSALQFLADRQDLENAMDIVARSRMKDQNDKSLLETGLGIVIVGSLALIQQNVDYIVSEGGIPIMLSVVNGTSLNVSSKVADQVLVPAIRCVARLMVDDNTIEDFIAEGGVQSLVAAIRGQSDKERVCEVCIFAISRLVESNAGFKELAKHGGLEALVFILQNRLQFEPVIHNLVALLNKIAKTKANGIRLLLERGIMEALLEVLKFYQNNPKVLIACANLLRMLQSSKRIDNKALHACSGVLLLGMRNSPGDAELAMAGMRLLAKLSREPDGVAFLQEEKAADVILTLLDQHYGNLELTAMATQILSQITGNKELIEAIVLLERLNKQLDAEPAKEEIMVKMILPVTLLGSMSSNANAAGAIIDANGFAILNATLVALQKAKRCSAQEKLSKHVAVCVSRLASHRQHIPSLIKSNTTKFLMAAVGSFLEYEDFVEETQTALEVTSRNPEAISYLIDSGTARCVATMVSAHPLNDNILLSATRLVTRLAKGADIQSLQAVRKEGTALALVAVNRFINTEDHLIDALSCIGQLASLSHDGSHIAIGKENMVLFDKVLKKHANSPSVMTSAARAIAALAEDRNFAVAVTTEALIDDVLRGLETYGDNEEYCAAALSVIYRVALVASNLPALEQRNVHGVVMETMGHHQRAEQVQLHGCWALKAMCAQEELTKTLAGLGAVRVIFNAMRAHPISVHVIMAGVSFIAEAARVKDVQAAVISERGKEMLQWAMRAYPQNADIQSTCQRALAILVGDEAELRRMQSEAEAKGAANVQPQAKEMEDAEAHKVLKSLVALMKIIRNPRSDKKQLAVALMSIAGIKATPEMLAQVLRKGGISRLIDVMVQHGEDMTILLPILKCFIRFADKGEHINLLVAYGGIGALLRAMKAHMKVPDVLAVGLKLLGKLSVYNRLKVLIGLHGGVPVLLEIMENYQGLAPLLNKCCYTLGNLASNCLPNRRAIVKGGGVNLISFAMQKHRSYLELVINSARALSPLCADDEASRVVVAKEGASVVIVRAIQLNPNNPGLLQNGLNCLHKVSKTPENLPVLIHLGAVQAVTAAMKAYRDNAELQQFGMEILSNLSSHQSRETGPLLVKGDTVEGVIRSALRHSNNTRIQVAACMCLQNLCMASPEEAMTVVRSGYVARVIETISHPKATDKTVLEGLKLLTVLATDEINATEMVRSGTPEVLVRLIRTGAANPEIVRNCLACLAKLSTTKENAAELASKGAIVAAVEALLDRFQDERHLTDVLRVLVNLSILEQNAITISETATAPLLKCVDNHFHNQPFIRMFCALLGNLSMWPAASQHLIDKGLIPIIIDTMKASINFPAVIVKLIKVLTNFTLVGENAKRILTSDGALTAVQEMMVTHRNHIQLTKAAEFFMFKLSGTTRRNSLIGGAPDLATYVTRKLSEHDRNMLTSGALMTKFSDGGGTSRRIIHITLDFTELQWTDPKNVKSADGSKSLPVRFIKEIRPGAATPALLKKKLIGGAMADPERSFAVFDVRQPGWALSVEADSPAEASKWVNALQALKQAYTEFTVGL